MPGLTALLIACNPKKETGDLVIMVTRGSWRAPTRFTHVKQAFVKDREPGERIVRLAQRSVNVHGDSESARGASG